MSNLNDVSAKGTNLWIEQMMSDAFPGIGKSKQSNLMTQQLIDTEIELSEALLQASDQLKEDDREKNGYVKWESLEERRDKKAKDVTDEILEKSSFKTRQIYEREKGPNWLIENVNKKVPKGTPLTPEMAQAFALKYQGDGKKVIENAKRLGYTIPTRGDLDRWQ